MVCIDNHRCDRYNENKVKMNENVIRDYFSKNWVFWLLRRLPPVAIVLGIPLVIFALGGVIAALTGNFYLFRCNLLAYPFGLAVALAAYTWFAIYFSKYLEQIYPAFESSPEEFGGKIKKWADRVANRFWVIGGASLVIAILNYLNLDTLWQPKIWLGDVWVTSPAPLFFKSYYAFIDVVAGGFVLGSGAVGIVGVMLLLHDLLSLHLKLSHIRILRGIGGLSIGLSIWALLAFAFVGPIRAVSAPNILCIAPPVLRVDSAIILSNLGASILASIAVVCGLLLPVYFAHRAIIRDKNLQIANLLEIQHELFTKADRLTTRYKKALAQEERHAANKGIQKQTQELSLELQQTYENIADVNKMIDEVESVPEWPMTANGAKELIAATTFPTISNLIIGLLPGQASGQSLTDVLKGMFTDLVQNLFKVP